MNRLEKNSSKTSRTARFGFRATLQQEALLRKVAENALCDQKIFFADDESFQTFQDILERPAQIKPKLRKLMKSRSPWEK
jgi:uncharacterized protein (DUF1778 family)